MTDRTVGVGIDLGTSLCAISRADLSTGVTTYMEAKETGGNREIPSVVYVDTNGTLTFGRVAEGRLNTADEAARVLTNFKLLLRDNQPISVPGTGDVDPSDLVHGLLRYLKRCF